VQGSKNCGREIAKKTKCWVRMDQGAFCDRDQLLVILRLKSCIS
jgi:hypothetical protein